METLVRCVATRGGTRTRNEKTEGDHRGDRGHGWPRRRCAPGRGRIALRHGRPRDGPAHHQDRRHRARHARLADRRPRHHGRDRADHRQRPDRRADADRHAAARRRPPRRPDGPRHQAEAQGHADARRQRQARRAEPQPEAAPARPAPGSATGNKKFKAGNAQQQEARLRAQAHRPRRRPRDKVAGARPTAPRRSTTRPSRSRSPAPPRSASRTSSSTSSGSRRSCSRSTRPPASSTACAGRSSRRSTRSRPTTAATSTSPPPARSGWMQFMPATWKQYGVDANKDGLQGSVQPGRRDLRRRPLPQGRRRRAGPAQGDLRLQPRRLVRGLRPHARAPDRRPAVELRRLAHRPDPGPLPGRRQGAPTPTTSPRRDAKKRQEALAQAG